MSGLLLNNMDLVVAAGLLLAVVITFIVYQTGLLPKRSLPFVAAAILGAVGISAFRAWRRSDLLKDMAKREDALKQQEETLRTLKGELSGSELKLDKANADLRKQRAAYQKELLLIEAKKKQEQERIDTLSEGDVFDEFSRTFGGGGQ